MPAGYTSFRAPVAPRRCVLCLSIALALAGANADAATLVVTTATGPTDGSTCSFYQALRTYHAQDPTGSGCVPDLTDPWGSNDTIRFAPAITRIEPEMYTPWDGSFLPFDGFELHSDLSIVGELGPGGVEIANFDLVQGEFGGCHLIQARRSEPDARLLHLSGLTITGGRGFPLNGGCRAGASIRVIDPLFPVEDALTLRVEQSVIQWGAGRRAGGIYVEGDLELRDSVIAHTWAQTASALQVTTARGGFSDVGGNATIERSTIRDTTGTCRDGLLGTTCSSSSNPLNLPQSFFDGTAIHVARSATLDQVNFTDNPAGASYNAIFADELRITNSRIANNGGGLRGVSLLTVEHSAVVGNRASAATLESQGEIVLRHSTVAGNTAANFTGLVAAYPTRADGIAVSAGQLHPDNTVTGQFTIENSTIVGNLSLTTPALSEAAVYAKVPVMNLDSSIVAANSTPKGLAAPDAAALPAAVAAVGAGNLFPPDGFQHIDLSALSGTVEALDPGLSALADNGCAVLAGAAFDQQACAPTMALLEGSPALDQGSNPQALDWDQRGAGFPRLTRTAVDIGAYEAPGGLLQITGNGLVIASGDDTPESADLTDFGTHYVGAPVDRSFSLTNTGLHALSIDAAVADAPFSIISPALPASIAPDASLDLEVRFDPALSIGTSTLVISNDGEADRSYVFDVRGMGVQLPQAPDSSEAVAFNTPLNFTLPTPIDGSPNGPFTYTWALVDGPAHGEIDLDSATGEASYVPDIGYSGADAFSYTVSNVNGVSLPAMVSLNVATGLPLVAFPQQIETAHATPAGFTLAGEDPNPSAPPLLFALVTMPQHGSLDLDANSGAATYTPDAGYAGDDSFEFTVANADGTSPAASVDIVIAAALPPDIFADGFE